MTCLCDVNNVSLFMKTTFLVNFIVFILKMLQFFCCCMSILNHFLSVMLFYTTDAYTYTYIYRGLNVRICQKNLIIDFRFSFRIQQKPTSQFYRPKLPCVDCMYLSTSYLNSREYVIVCDKST